MKYQSLLPSAAATLTSAFLFSSASLNGAIIYTAGHGDLGVEYTPGETEFESHWHLGAGAVLDGIPLDAGGEYAPDEVIARLGTTTTVSSSVAAALDVSNGAIVYRTGITAYPPNLGFGLEEVGEPTDWAGESITLSLTGFSGPGEMAVSQTISGFGTFVWFSSSDSSLTVDDNNWEFGVGGHQHLDWWFSEAGNYEVTFTWSGTYIGGVEPIDVTGSGTFGFQVVPEPGTLGLIAPGVLALLASRRRRPSA